MVSDPSTAATKRDASLDAVSTLRGAGVEVDARRVTRVAIGICLVSLAFATALLFVAGAHKNAQITALRHGQPVVVTVTSCYGLLGGSGSNKAGYVCDGSFTAKGHRYDEPIPGSSLYARGTKVNAITALGDPGLFDTVGDVASEHASDGVFIVPAALLAVLLGGIGIVMIRRRSAKEPASRLG